MNNKAQFTPLKKAVRVIPMLYAEAFAGSNNKEFVVKLYEDARLLETAAPAMFAALQNILKFYEWSDSNGDEQSAYDRAIKALAQAEGK